MRTLSYDKVKKFYDRFGARQDRSTLYERLPIELLIKNSEFGDANSIVEFGCGTGALAATLLSEHLCQKTSYMALDISETMVALAHDRLASWSHRVTVQKTNGQVALDLPESSCDRFIITYVCDLLSIEDINNLILEAHRVLCPQGLLCMISMTAGHGIGAKLATGLWRVAYAVSPVLVGGCRPIRLWRYLYADYWEPKFRSVVCPGGLCSEILVAKNIKGGAASSAGLAFNFNALARP